MSNNILKTIVVDLDDTICFPNHSYDDTERKYELASPNLNMIEALHRAKAKDYRIVVYTARRMLTHHGDLQKIEEDAGEATRKWLNKYNVPCDELIFGKPYAEYYVDDKALRPDEFVRLMNA